MDISPITRATLGLADAVDLFSARMGRESGLSSGDLSALVQIRLAGGVVPYPLARLRVHLAANNVTALLDRFESEGLTARVVNPADRRSFGIVLTDAGRALADEFLIRLEDAVTNALQHRDDESGVGHFVQECGSAIRADEALHRESRQDRPAVRPKCSVRTQT